MTPCVTSVVFVLCQEHTASRGRSRPSWKAMRRTEAVAAANRATCHTCCPATPHFTCAGSPGRSRGLSTSWRATASSTTTRPPCSRCLTSEGSSSATMSRYRCPGAPDTCLSRSSGLARGAPAELCKKLDSEASPHLLNLSPH